MSGHHHHEITWKPIERQPRRQLEIERTSVLWKTPGDEGVAFVVTGCTLAECACTEVDLNLVGIDGRTVAVGWGGWEDLHVKTLATTPNDAPQRALNVHVDYSTGELSGADLEAVP